ncbi:MAG TPA: fibronectin type III domain-containing protein, partial [Chitinophagaceae bacterium]|nr:fibronectin type III domain-containing protein [Chitinophagaceae bacterium]
SMGTFTALIPCSGTTGNHRLRVRCSYNNNGVNIDPCNLMNSYGEAEDYTITILAPTGCTPPNTLSVSNLAAKNATLNWNAGCTETSWNVHLTTAGGGAPTGTSSHPSVTSNPLLVAGLTPGTAYEFWVQAICSGGNSIWTGPFAFTTLPVCSTIPGTSFSNPIDLGQAHCISLASSNTQTNVSANCFSNNYTGTANQNSPDIWYRFTLSQNATVQISHCNSSFDTYLHLLNSTGTQIQGNDDNGPLCTGLRASISATLNAGTYYIVSEGYGNNTGAITTLLNTTEICPAAMSFATKNFLQGYWNGMNGMVPVLNNQGISAGVQDCDSLNIQIHQAQSPYPIVASATSILQQDGTTQWQLPVLYGNYYIHIRHRNAVDTWSATPIPFSHYASSYDFSTAANKAFGNNQVNLAPGIWGFYTGDLNEDDNIDILDGTVLENDIFIFGSGYLATDLNGDGNTDLLDDPLLQSNISNFIFSSHP